MFGISVQGGTNAGIRRVKGLQTWFCCGKSRGIAYSCPNCGQRRPGNRV